MSGVEYLLKVYPISSHGLPEEHATNARELERQMIIRTYADALEQVGITAASAKKIAAEYYRQTYDT